MKEPLASRSGLVIVEDAAALVHALADRFVESARDAIAERARFDVSLSGGSTPRDAYAMLADEPLRNSLDWSKVRFFFGDERCVPPGDAQSNYNMARTALFEPLAIPQSQIFRIRGEDEPSAAARAYADVLKTELGPNPVFDLILLGMGPDGHTASLFPGSDPCEDDEALVRAPYVQKFAAYRITITPRVINAAREVVLAAGGAEKAAAITRALEGPHDPVQCPVQIVGPADGCLTWIVDRLAAGRLRGRTI